MRFKLLVVVAVIAASVGIGSQEASAAPPAIWVGSPIGVKGGSTGPSNGVWGTPPYKDTLPALHHKLAVPQVLPAASDWSVDLSRIPSTDKAVKVYAAPSNSAYDSRVTTKILSLSSRTCRAGGGGDTVVVGVYFDNALVGRAVYGHIRRASGLYVGKPIGRWGGTIGSVAWLTAAENPGGSDCWTGPHVHFELRAEKNYACWNKGYVLGSDIGRSNFFGFVTGPVATTARPCP